MKNSPKIIFKFAVPFGFSAESLMMIHLMIFKNLLTTWKNHHRKLSWKKLNMLMYVSISTSRQSILKRAIST